MGVGGTGAVQLLCTCKMDPPRFLSNTAARVQNQYKKIKNHIKHHWEWIQNWVDQGQMKEREDHINVVEEKWARKSQMQVIVFV